MAPARSKPRPSLQVLVHASTTMDIASMLGADQHPRPPRPAPALALAFTPDACVMPGSPTMIQAPLHPLHPDVAHDPPSGRPNAHVLPGARDVKLDDAIPAAACLPPSTPSSDPTPSPSDTPNTSVGYLFDDPMSDPVTIPGSPSTRKRPHSAEPDLDMTTAVEDPAMSPSKRRNIGGRPKGWEPPTTPKARGPTRLRKGRMVISKIPMDIWEHVLSFCPGKFLAKARRISKSFHRVLTYESVWKKNRMMVYGPDLPDPFPGMREDHYANLLEGLGCMDCGNPRTRKTYWPWQRRWCADCLHRNTVKQEDAATTLLDVERDLLEKCIPYGTVDSWGNYEMAGDYDRSWSRQGHGRQKIFGKADVSSILAERESFVGARPRKTEKEYADWLEEKRVARDAAMDRIQKIEDWVETRARGKVHLNAKRKMQRVEYFTKRAGELDPPILPEALSLIQAYKRAVEIPRAPSERAWRALVPKLLKDREAAQAAVHAQRTRAAQEDRDRIEQAEYIRRMNRRADGGTPEQHIVALIADRVIDQLRRASPPVADADFVLLALREIRRLFYEIQKAGGVAAVQGYSLVLEDARWALESKLRPEMNCWPRARRLAATSFKCPGCARTDVNLRYSFEALFVHLRRRHAAALGDFHMLFGDGLEAVTTFPWLNVHWPLNLPVLADHQVALGKWNPDDPRAYVRAPVIETGAVTGSAFDGRTIYLHDGDHDATANIVYAGLLLRDTGLDPTLKTKIVIQYAARKYKTLRRGLSLPRTVEYIRDLPLDLMRAGVYDLFDQFRCAACLERDRTTARVQTKVHSLESLIDHFRHWHGLERSWSNEMIRLPDDEELWRKLNAPANVKALQVFEQLFPLATAPVCAPSSDDWRLQRLSRQSPTTADASVPSSASSSPSWWTASPGEHKAPFSDSDGREDDDDEDEDDDDDNDGTM